MSTFKETGFLSDDVESIAKEFTEHFPLWKNLYYDANKYAAAQFYKVRADDSSRRNVLIYASYWRALCVYQSAFLLLERGNENDGKVLLRNLVETVFILRALHLKPLFHERLIKFDIKKQMDMYSTAITLHDKKTADGKVSVLTKELADDMRNTVATYTKNKSVSTSALHIAKGEKIAHISEIAELADMEDEYAIEYTYLCKFTHPSAFGMESSFIGDATGKPISFYAAPMFNDILANMRTGIKMMLKAVAAFADFYKLPIEAEVVVFGERLKALEKTATS